jgi:DNA-binding Lrp family transcriptional regulator
MSEKKKKGKKDVELRLIAELMRNCHRSDRELARTLGISQPTVTRIRNRLEKEGIVKEYAMIPDFRRLGYNLMGVTFFSLAEPLGKEGEKELRKTAVEVEKQNTFGSLIIVRGLGMQKDRMFITLYKDYTDYNRTIQLTKQLANVNIESMESFLVDLNDENNYRILTMAQIARHILSSDESAKA